ncbi:ABC transporter permease [Kineosporia succinea]|uniref:Oligopeptide transport system permease protein n=1 Tax=Kineosporia succinea TaxID=84632 RepID=A0ABT9NYK6_9ACTN|nr:ABC transporter permease [Kineosporia succinea]MDP9825507.1 oligopeptide transport system permease protein [Kineosporia succinea]
MSELDQVAAAETIEGAPGTPTASVVAAGRSRTLAGDAWETLRSSWVFWASVVVIGVLIVMAVWPGLFAHADPLDCQASRSRGKPGGDAWFGYDVQGCDVYARTMYGARASIMVGAMSTVMSLIFGSAIGIYAGFYGGWVDSILSRITDIFIGIPVLLGSMIILSSIPTPPGSQFLGILKVSLAISILAWPSTARVARSAVIQVKQSDFVAASRALGASRGWMIRKHIIPNSAAPVIVISTISLGGYIGAEATLSYLGIGLQPPVVSWGIAINDAAAYLRNTPHMLLFPALFLAATVLAFIALGDQVREALDPKTM